jgi:glycosyltransferase involved in cell wall biosynthesis
MRLFYFSGSTLPSTYANAVHVMKMCAALAHAEHEVVLFAKGNGRADEALFAAYDVERCFTVKLVPHVPLPGLSGIVRSLITLMQARMLGKVDLIYGRDFWTMAAMAGRKTPIMLELHEIPAAGKAAVLLRRILSAPNLKGIVVISAGLKEDLMRFYPVPDRKILIAHDGADAPDTPVEPGSLQDIPGTDFQIGYGGSLYKGKGVELIAAIAALKPDTGFHVFGGPEAERQKWLAQNLPPNIRLYGHVSHRDLKPRLAACDALIAPYMPEIRINTGADISRWISPLKLFEYMALRKPILCSDLPVLREVMQHERNALLADPDSPPDWAAEIARLKSDPGLSQGLAEEAYNDLVSHYSWDIRAKTIIDFFQSLS